MLQLDGYELVNNPKGADFAVVKAERLVPVPPDVARSDYSDSQKTLRFAVTADRSDAIIAFYQDWVVFLVAIAFVIIAGLATAFGFALIWHMWLPAALLFVATVGAAIVHTFNYKRDYHIPVETVEKTEAERTRQLAAAGA